MNFRSITHGNPSELEYFANKTEYGLKEILDRRREGVVERNKEFELARNAERKEYLEDTNRIIIK